MRALLSESVPWPRGMSLERDQTPLLRPQLREDLIQDTADPYEEDRRYRPRGPGGFLDLFFPYLLGTGWPGVLFGAA